MNRDPSSRLAEEWRSAPVASIAAAAAAETSSRQWRQRRMSYPCPVSGASDPEGDAGLRAMVRTDLQSTNAQLVYGWLQGNGVDNRIRAVASANGPILTSFVSTRRQGSILTHSTLGQTIRRNHSCVCVLINCTLICKQLPI